MIWNGLVTRWIKFYKIIIIMKKIDALKLYLVLTAITSSSLEKDDKIALILLRTKLRKVAEEHEQLIEETRKVIPVTDLKPAIDNAVKSWGDDEIEINSNIFSENTILSLLKENNLVGIDEDILYLNLVKV